MKVLVPLKRVIDYNVVVQIDSSQKNVVTDHVKMSINPFDEIALEEAVRLHEADVVEEVIVVSIGSELSQEQLRQGLAMGAHRAILIPCDDAVANDPLSVAKILSTLVTRDGYDFVLMGKQAIDNDCNQTGQMLAGLLKWPQATFASKISFSNDEISVSREIDGGLDNVSCQLPAVVTVDLRLNDPRYISLPNIMMAKSKPLQIESLDALKLDLTPCLKRICLEFPQPRTSGEIFTDFDLFVKKLDEEEVWR